MATSRKVKSKAKPTTAPVWLTAEAVRVPIDAVQLHPKNANVGDVDRIRRSMRKNGIWGVLIVQKSTGYVCAGNHRLKAMRLEGLSHVWVQYADIDDAAAIKLLLADNRIAARASYDSEALDGLLDDLSDEEVEDVGFDIAPTEDPEETAEQLGEVECRIVIVCKDETHQATLLDRFEKEGLKCTALMS